MNSQREALLEEARKYGEQLIISAENEARERIKDHYLAREAEARGQELMNQAERRAAQMRVDAEQYVYQVLADLDNRLERLSVTVRGGLQALEPNAGSTGAQRSRIPTLPSIVSSPAQAARPNLVTKSCSPSTLPNF